jgi:hypothetical protein
MVTAAAVPDIMKYRRAGLVLFVLFGNVVFWLGNDLGVFMVYLKIVH